MKTVKVQDWANDVFMVISETKDHYQLKDIYGRDYPDALKHNCIEVPNAEFINGVKEAVLHISKVVESMDELLNLIVPEQ